MGIIRDAVVRVHKAMVLALMLLNVRMRTVLDEEVVDTASGADKFLADFFDANWIMKAYREVTVDGAAFAHNAGLRSAWQTMQLGNVALPSRRGIAQCLRSAATNIVATASTNVWFHFIKRVEKHVLREFATDRPEWLAMTKNERKCRTLALKRVALDVCRMPGETLRSDESFHQWVHNERDRLGLVSALEGAMPDTNFLYNLKARPHRFLYAMSVLSAEKEFSGRAAFSLYPLRRTMVPRYVHFCQKALRDLLGLGGSDFTKQRAKDTSKKQKKVTSSSCSTWDLPPLVCGGEGAVQALCDEGGP